MLSLFHIFKDFNFFIQFSLENFAQATLLCLFPFFLRAELQICLHLYSHFLFLIPFALHAAVSFFFTSSFHPMPFDAPLYLFVLPLSCFLFHFTVTPFNPRVSFINPSYSSSSTHSLYPCPSASSYFHIPELIPLSPRL